MVTRSSIGHRLSSSEASFPLMAPVSHVLSTKRPPSQVLLGGLGRTLGVPGTFLVEPWNDKSWKISSHAPFCTQDRPYQALGLWLFFFFSDSTADSSTSLSRAASERKQASIVRGKSNQLTGIKRDKETQRGKGPTQGPSVSPSWYNNGLSEEFYILAKVPLTGMTSPKRDDTDHLTVDSHCWQTRSEAQRVYSCPLWPDLILTFPKLLLKPCYSWPQRMREEMGEGLLLTSRSWVSPKPRPWTKSTTSFCSSA